VLLHITNDDQLINEKIKSILMWKLSLILNENIEWHCMQIELNWIPIKLKRNGMQIGGESIENSQTWVWCWKNI
jgi:hypothetical protein